MLSGASAGGTVLAGSAVVAALLVVAALIPRRPLAAFATSVLCGIGALLALGYLIAGAPAAALALPVGLPGAGAVLALDGLSGGFLLLVFAVSAAAAFAAIDDDPAHPHAATAAAFPPFVAGMVLTLLAGDAFTLLFGFEAMSVASFALVLTHDDDGRDGAGSRSAALLYLGMALLATACLVPALALLAPAGPLAEAVQFAAMRAHPPEGVRAAVVLALVLAGAGAKAGLAPLHVWLPSAHAAAPSHVSALMSGAMTKVALYVLIRVLFDLCGAAQPLWWGVPLLVMGGGGAVLGGLRAALEGDFKTVLACSTVEHVSLIATALGVALAARGADLTPLASLALGAALLHCWAHGTFKALLFLCAGAVQRGAGTRTLSRLGGLIHHMPVTAACAILGCASLAALPPTSGFAGEWALFQSLLGAPRIGVLGLQILVCAIAALVAVGVALAGVAGVRLIGVAFLGRPRSPRAAGAQEARVATRGAMLAMAALTGAVGLFPSTAVALLEPATRVLLRSGGLAPGVFVFAPQTGAPGYQAVPVALLLALGCGAVWLAHRSLARRSRVAGRAPLAGRAVPAWDGGFGAPPPWMPFGDPATQYGAASFSQPVRRAVGGAVMAAREAVDMPAPGDRRAAVLAVATRDPAAAWLFAPAGRLRERVSRAVDPMSFLTVRRTLGVMFAALVLFLAAVALWEQT